MIPFLGYAFLFYHIILLWLHIHCMYMYGYIPSFAMYPFVKNVELMKLDIVSNTSCI